jgi:hypothetical protein
MIVQFARPACNGMRRGIGCRAEDIVAASGSWRFMALIAATVGFHRRL